MNNPLISVVMVTCNVEHFLAEAIESILGQTFREFEFIIVDFGSTDSSKAIAQSYVAKDARVRLHEIPHCGLAAARNASCFLREVGTSRSWMPMTSPFQTVSGGRLISWKRIPKSASWVAIRSGSMQPASRFESSASPQTITQSE